MPDGADLEQLRRRLKAETNGLVSYIFDSLAPALIPDNASDATRTRRDKVVNDPIWKVFSLSQPLQILADLPLLQRLRRVRQLGLVHLVYPGGHHTRFEHSLGAMCAADRMFDMLADSGRMQGEFRKHQKSLVLCAAILHDSGHTVFSHVGERVLQQALKQEFANIGQILDAAFPDAMKSPGAATGSRPKLPAAAELLSAVFALSPSMDRVIPRLALAVEPNEAIMEICGLILGRPRNIVEADTYYYWVKCIISGDLDCDKIDYVARDAYYAGIPTATDIDRLMSQLVAVEARHDTDAPDLTYRFGNGNADEIQLFGIRPAGASTLEMFVMTRSYLYERLYAHPKVRAAERFLERILVQRVQYGRDEQSWIHKDIFDLLYAPAGDDYVLGKLTEDRYLPNIGDHFSSMAARILTRRLPVRALAISPLTMAEAVPQGDSIDSAQFMPWQAAEDELGPGTQGTVDFETRVCELTNLQFGHDVIIDWYLPNPIREDPDIWVADAADGHTVKRVSSYFNVEQLANAYRSTKQVAWVFADSETASRVAGAAAITLGERYDLIPNRDGFTRAKIPVHSVDPFFDELLSKSDDLRDIIANIRSTSIDRRILRPPARILARGLLALDENERMHVGARLSRQVAEAKLARAFYNDLYVANQVLGILLKHCKAFYRDALFSKPVSHQNERRFQNHLRAFCETDSECCTLFNVTAKPESERGTLDLLFQAKTPSTDYPSVVVELKSDPAEEYGRQYEAHAGQPFQYAGAHHGRVSILYVQFKSDASVRMADTIQVRANAHEQSQQLVFCLGQQAFADVPSALGQTSVPLGNS